MTEEQPMNFSKRPIIVLGVNHSGTRVLVDILSMLGSDGGDCNNTWRENKFFLSLHKEMVKAVDAGDWNRKIFKLDKISRLALDSRCKEAIRNRLERELFRAYPAYASRPWHWKCPTSALFIDFWLETYPEAYYVHIVRDPLDVAQSLISRRQFYTIRSAKRFYELLEAYLARASGRRYLCLRYETLTRDLSKLIEFMPFLDGKKIEAARGLIRESSVKWKKHRSFKHNLWNMATAGRIALAKLVRGQ